MRVLLLLFPMLLVSGLNVFMSTAKAGDQGNWEPDAWRPRFSAFERGLPHVQARSHDLKHWPFLDGQWEGIVTDSAGEVWFSVSTHHDREHAQVFHYDPKKDQVTHIADLGQATGEKLTGHPPQDKIHGQMFERGESIYSGTCEGHAIPGNPYQGGYWIKIHKPTGAVTTLAKSITDDGLLNISYDPWRNILYAMTNRTGELVRFDPETGTERVLGVPWRDYIQRWKASDDPDKPKAIWPRSLTLMIPPTGKVFGAKPPGLRFWCYDPETDEIRDVEMDMPIPAVVKANEKNAAKRWERALLHMTRWDEQDECFYAIRSVDQMLVRIRFAEDGRTGTLEEVQQMGLEKSEHGNYLASITLNIDDDRNVWYVPYTGWGGVAHLQSYNLETGQFVDHGPIVVEGGRRIAECHAMTLGEDGKLYLVAFTYSLQGEDPANPWGMRGPYPFHPRLVIIDPKRHLKRP